jgi:hypothetical protein
LLLLLLLLPLRLLLLLLLPLLPPMAGWGVGLGRAGRVSRRTPVPLLT